MPKQTPPEYALDATLHLTARTRVSDTIGDDTEKSVYHLGYPCSELCNSREVHAASASLGDASLQAHRALDS